MDTLTLWLEPDELALLPENISAKLNMRIQESKDSLLRIQSEHSHSLSSYEQTIAQLSKNLQEQSQKYYELELKYLKIKTMGNTVALESIDDSRNPARTRKSPKLVRILKSKITALSTLNSELESKNRSLNSQVEFLIQNRDIDTQESCLLAARYLSELNEMKSQIQPVSLTKTIENLKNELSILRSNEKEYQDYVYLKAREIYELENVKNSLESENLLLKKYRQMYENIHLDYIQICSTVTELKIKNLEYKKLAENSNALQTIYNYIVSKQSPDKNNSSSAGMLNHTLENSNEYFHSEFELIKNDLNALVLHVNSLVSTKNEIQQFFSILMSTNSKIDNSEIQFIKSENEVLKAKIATLRTDSDLLFENEDLKCRLKNISEARSYDELMGRFNDVRDSYDKITAEFGDLKNSYDELSRQFNDLKNTHDELQLTHKNTLTAFSELQNTNSNLQATCDSLKATQGNSCDNSNAQLSSTITDLKKTIKTLKKESLEDKLLIQDLQDKVARLEEDITKLEDERYDNTNQEDEDYIRNLEDQLDSYKKDVKTIESQFTEYRKLYESLNLNEKTNKANEEHIGVMKTNIERKDQLIESLYSLVGRYRRISELFISQQ